MSRVCPSDTYKVFKRGSCVRIDTTLIGFDNISWQRGNRSYLFNGSDDEAYFYEIDHDAREYSMEVMKDIDVEMFENGIPPTKDSIQLRLQTPIISNSIDIDKISFERNKSGWFAWKNEKNESINGYDCRVYNASNVEFITKTRSEHLNESQNRSKNTRTPLQHFLGLTDVEDYDHASEKNVSSITKSAWKLIQAFISSHNQHHQSLNSTAKLQRQQHQPMRNHYLWALLRLRNIFQVKISTDATSESQKKSPRKFSASKRICGSAMTSPSSSRNRFFRS